MIHLRTLHLGPDELLVVGKLAVNSAADGARLAETINRAERAARSAVPGLALVMYLEPDLDRGPSCPAGLGTSGRRVSGAGSRGATWLTVTCWGAQVALSSPYIRRAASKAAT